MKINSENMIKGIENGFINATDVADYLAKKGLPFRDAHRIVGELVVYCELHTKKLSELNIAEYKKFSDLFKDDIGEKISIKECVEARESYGGTGPKSVSRQIKLGEEFLKKYIEVRV